MRLRLFVANLRFVLKVRLYIIFVFSFVFLFFVCVDLLVSRNITYELAFFITM